MMAQENRQSSRKSDDAAVDVYDSLGKLIPGIAHLVNVSLAGACFTSSHPFKEKESLHLRVRLAKEGRFEIAARIIWSKPDESSTQYGIAFDEVKRVSEL
jgi:hypothetical protein